jgi:flavorubredoxin
MKPVEIKKGIYWVGAVDWNVRTFHGHTYSTPRGTTYNAYLIVDDKIALVDTVLKSFGPEMLDRIGEIVDPARIDYVVANHVETDHSGALPGLLKLCPKAQVFGTARCGEGLFRSYYGKWDFKAVKTGDSLKLGKKTLAFIEAPMIHWPDSMFTYCPEESLLMSNDAFGQHLASAERFADEIDPCALWDEAKKYYANILWPLGTVIEKKIIDVAAAKLKIDTIAPSHGLIWRTEPQKIIQSYLSWARQETEPKAVIVYETMWQATAKMARCIADGIIDAGARVKIYDISVSDRTDIFKEMLDSRGFCLGSSTHDNSMLPSMAAFTHMLKGFRPKGRMAVLFGSYGWAGGAVKELEEAAKAAGIGVPLAPLQVKYAMDGAEERTCYEMGKEFGKKLFV